MADGLHRVDVDYIWPNTLIHPPRPPRVVYLDLNHWIALSKALAGHRDGARFRDALAAITAAVRDGRIIVPISDTTFIEVAKIGRHRQRREIREVIETISGFSVVTARSVISVHELEALLDTVAGPNPQPINAMHYLDWGVMRAFGRHGALHIRDSDGRDVTDAVRSAWKAGPDAFDQMVLTSQLELQRRSLDGPTPQEEAEMRGRGWNPRAATEVAGKRARQELEQVLRFNDDPRWRRGRIRDVVAARELIIELLDPLTEGLNARDSSVAQLVASPEQARELFDAMPSFDVSVSLKTSYHRNPEHQWKVNDIHDIDALASTIPYCDVVVTDTAAAAHANRSGLDERLGTRILSDLDSLVSEL